MKENSNIQLAQKISAHSLGEIIQALSTCLSLQRDMGITRLDLSPETIALMDHWQRGKLRPMVRPALSKASLPSQNFRTHLPGKTDVSQNHGATPQKNNFSKSHETVTAYPSSDSSREKVKPVQDMIMPVIQSRGTSSSGIFFLCDAVTRDQHQQPDITLGPAGELFLNILKAMHLDADQVHIISFSPPSSRKIPPDETWQKQIKTHVFQKVKALNPRIICTMGETAMQVMLGNEVNLSNGEGQFHNMATALLIPTFHPAQLIEDLSLKRPVWETMKRIMQRAEQD
ncbi:uracil-DNA glycosylase family protein [Desulfocicer niacini]